MAVIEALEQAFRRQSLSIRKPVHVEEARPMCLCACRYVRLQSLRKPIDNGYAESRKATLRLECLGRHWFLDLHLSNKAAALSSLAERTPCLQFSSHLKLALSGTIENPAP